MSLQCKLCPVECGADRTTENGACGAGNTMRVAKYGLHPYEEPCISCKNGSGTVFFSGCALRCVFCQNFELSRARVGQEVTPERLAAIFRELEEMGAENINLVTASHYVPQLIKTFAIYRPKIPVVYNTHSYEKLEALRALDKYIDVYLPDMKYFSPKISARYTGKADYFEYAGEAVKFMASRAPQFEGGKMVHRAPPRSAAVHQRQHPNHTVVRRPALPRLLFADGAVHAVRRNRKISRTFAPYHPARIQKGARFSARFGR